MRGKSFDAGSAPEPRDCSTAASALKEATDGVTGISTISPAWVLALEASHQATSVHFAPCPWGHPRWQEQELYVDVRSQEGYPESSHRKENNKIERCNKKRNWGSH